MRAIDIINKKRVGDELTADEIAFLVSGYVTGTVPDYQMSAWLMAVVWRGLTDAETFALTGAMVASGRTLDLSGIGKPTVDKHSTGGVGDKTTLAVVPILAAGGVAVAKMSGRGLGHTGGTLDKLAAIPGMRAEIPLERIIDQTRTVGACICAQSDELVPADRMIYALRDATGTVHSPELIAASIMSKKIAGGCDAIVLDVKAGAGAFMQTVADARALADLMVRIGAAHGRRVAAIITDMDTPLGYAVGNAVEVQEIVALLTASTKSTGSTASIASTQSIGDPRLHELVCTLAAIGFLLADIVSDLTEGKTLAQDLIENGKAFEKLCQIVEAQGGDPDYLRHPDRTPIPTPHSLEGRGAWREGSLSTEGPEIGADVLAPHNGYIRHIDAGAIGLAAMRAGAGRETKDAAIDHDAGIVLRCAVGRLVERGDIIARVYAADDAIARRVAPDVLAAFEIAADPAPPIPIIQETIGAQLTDYKGQRSIL